MVWYFGLMGWDRRSTGDDVDQVSVRGEAPGDVVALEHAIENFPAFMMTF